MYCSKFITDVYITICNSNKSKENYTMNHLSTEHRYLDLPQKAVQTALADNIARHIREYQIYGRVVVLAQNPEKLLIEIKKAWNNLKREMRDDIESREDGNRKSLLINQLMYMQQYSFAAKAPIENANERAVIATIQQVLEWPPVCQTMYVTYDVELSELYRATAWMPPYGLVVTYHFKEDT